MTPCFCSSPRDLASWETKFGSPTAQGGGARSSPERFCSLPRDLASWEAKFGSPTAQGGGARPIPERTPT